MFFYPTISERTVKLKKLSFFDLTNIIIGSIVGADIHIASAITAGLVGPMAIFADNLNLQTQEDPYFYR